MENEFLYEVWLALHKYPGWLGEIWKYKRITDEEMHKLGDI